MRYAKDGIGYAAATPTIYYLHSFAKTCVSPAVNTCLEVSVCGGELNRSISIIVVPSNGPPSNLDWSRPWHEILHEWNGKVQSVAIGTWYEAVEPPFLDSLLEIGNAFCFTTT